MNLSRRAAVPVTLRCQDLPPLFRISEVYDVNAEGRGPLLLTTFILNTDSSASEAPVWAGSNSLKVLTLVVEIICHEDVMRTGQTSTCIRRLMHYSSCIS